MCNMDEYLRKQMYANSFNFKKSLDRIVDKYSKLQYQDRGIEVDLNLTNMQVIEHHMNVSKTELSKLETKSLADLRDESLSSQDITRDPQMDFMHQDSVADETQFSVEDIDGIARRDVTQLTVSSLDESQRSLSEMELQPEDQDEVLEMSLRRHGCSLVDLYPGMISRIERAWHRHHVSEAADSVLRRYRRWRQQPNRSSLNNTFVVTRRQGNPNMTSSNERSSGPVKVHAILQSPLQMVNNLQDLQAQQQSPGRGRVSLRREQPQPVLVMDLSGLSETSKPNEISLNETFNVSEQGEQPSAYAVSPSRPLYTTAKASLDLSLRSKRLFHAAHSPQIDGCSMYAWQTTAVKERPDIYSSPVRQSPLKARAMTSLSRSPHAFSRSPRAHSVEGFSREPLRPRSFSTSLSSPPQMPAVPPRMFCPQDSRRSVQSQLPSPQSAAAAVSRHRLRRHLSFDSSLPSIHVSYSPKELDEDFIKLYHKFVCQNKSSFFSGTPCRLCERSSDASRGRSSSALAALALSPHRSLLRKRHRELSWGTNPQSKRSRDEYCKSSPGSKRHGNEMLRRRLTLPEPAQSRGVLYYSPSEQYLISSVSAQQRSVDKHQETWMSLGHNISAVELSGLGCSLERKMANAYSPRK